MATNVHLTPELEEFARACVETGRYNNVSEVMRAGLRLLQEREDRRRAFAKMVEDAEAEAEKEGTYTIDEVAAELDAIIAGKA
jgi:putative addiction module antidote protein, CC2985 family